MTTRDWDVRDLYSDSSGRMRARILSWSRDEIRMKRWMANKPEPQHGVRFTLSESYFLSERCGWRLHERGKQ